MHGGRATDGSAINLSVSLMIRFGKAISRQLVALLDPDHTCACLNDPRRNSYQVQKSGDGDTGITFEYSWYG